MQQLRERDQELAVLTGELEGLRGSNQQLRRAQAAVADSQAQVAAVQEAERQVQQLQGMVSVCKGLCWYRTACGVWLGGFWVAGVCAPLCPSSYHLTSRDSNRYPYSRW